MSRSRWTHSFLHSGPTQSCLQIRSALAGSESAGTRYRDCDSEHMSCSHPLASIVVAMGKRDMAKDVPKFPNGPLAITGGHTQGLA